MADPHDGRRQSYVNYTPEQIRAELLDYANSNDDSSEESREVHRRLAAILWNVAWRQGDAATALGAVIELIEDICEEMAQQSNRISELEASVARLKKGRR